MKGKKTYFMNKGGCGNYKAFFNYSEISKLESSFKEIIEEYKIDMLVDEELSKNLTLKR